MDLYRLVKLNPEEATLESKELYQIIERVKSEILILNEKNKISIDPILKTQSSLETVSEAIKTFNTYYEKELVIEKNEVFILNEINILFYYHNKLKGYGLEKLI